MKFVVSKFEHSFRSGESHPRRRGRGVQAPGHRAERHVGPGRLSAAYRVAGCAARRGRDLGAGEARRAQGDRRLGRAVRHRERDQPAREARAPHRAHVCGRLVDERHARATATFWSWCASAANCSRRSSARSRTQGVEVAGADRLVLTEHIAVMDLMALADALLLPEDDLALATVLRSPLFGFTDDDLFAIAWDRGRSSLRAALAAKARRAADICGRRGAARRACAGGAARDAVCVLCAAARRRRRPAALPRPARRGGQRRARRVSQSRVRLRAARDAVAARLSDLAARCARRGEARHGNRAATKCAS